MADLVIHLSENPLAHIEESGEEERYETDFVESALKKFGKLLQIAFGEAGSAIIARNLSNDGDPDPMIPGKKMMAIFGFCDIRSFTDCTECLQEDVMVFVNRIASYVHRAVVDNMGAPNKNIGDAFLLVWRLPDPESARLGRCLTLFCYSFVLDAFSGPWNAARLRRFQMTCWKRPCSTRLCNPSFASSWKHPLALSSVR